MNLVNPSILVACILSFCLGAIGCLAFSPFDIWLVAYLSAAGLIWAATLIERKTAMLATFAWSIGYFGVGVQWVNVSMTQFGGVPVIVSYLAVLLLASYLGLYNLLFSYLARRFGLISPFVLASLFTFTEYLRGVVFTGFPWLQFGYTQIDSPFAQLAPIFGVEGLTFLVILLSSYLVDIVKNPTRKIATFTKIAVIIGFSLASNLLQFVQIDQQKPPVKVALIQANIEQQLKWDPAHFENTLRTYQQLINSSLAGNEVVILPESAIPALESKINPLLNQLQKMAAAKNTEIIIGTLYENEQQQLFNSALVLGNQTKPYQLHQSLRYNKHHLVPFGEYVPFGSLLDWMREVFILPVNLSKGPFIQPALFTNKGKFNMAICYEVIFGHQLQQNQLAQQADYLVTITNDAWFGDSIGPWQHLQMARMRALELGKPLLRAANTGITAVVGFDGKVIKKLPQFETNTLTAEIATTKGHTLFGQFGHWLIYSLSFICVAFGLFRRQKHKKH
ncbi:apolipoprotein N-acyltransferase [[Haemophilus] ducreyi]|uniref:apolipoprotein N-acyltransferase n=1 Tax=Haemophilus ducreyi TaxID=730 RepID=UPI0007CDC3F9|nr:apolipoprotein N-acyltransferase [[Haemophilus] ducreyi]ANF67659.1 apolipoprotein N-acyltransferase [[Haemophilus] ducreyi]ANF69775.1 apolipoprotein N-acyltransferase [[Haemophilus] ducreyi]